jgi:hypothetical protein
MVSFDSSFSTQAISAEHKIYKLHGMCLDKQATEAYNYQYTTRGFNRTRHGERIAYTVPGKRKSGTPNTSCGNSLINALLHTKYLHEVGIYDFKLIVLGDDVLIVCQQTGVDKQGLSAFMRHHGFEVKSKIQNNICEAEFCSKLFWPSTIGLVLASKPGRQLAKIGYSLTKPIDPAQHMAGVAKSMPLDMAVPFLRTYLAECVRRSPNVKPLPSYGFNNYTGDEVSATTETYAFFEERYGFSHLRESSLEEQIRQPAANSHSLVTNPWVLILMEKDL